MIASFDNRWDAELFDAKCISRGAIRARHVCKLFYESMGFYKHSAQMPPFVTLFNSLVKLIESEHIVVKPKTQDDMLRFFISEWTTEVPVRTASGATELRKRPRWPAYHPDCHTFEDLMTAVARAFDKKEWEKRERDYLLR